MIPWKPSESASCHALPSICVFSTIRKHSLLRFAINIPFAMFSRFYFWPAFHHPINCSPCASKITDTSVRMPPICLPHLSLPCFCVFLYVAILFFVIITSRALLYHPECLSFFFSFFNSVHLSPISGIHSDECSARNLTQCQCSLPIDFKFM